MSSRALRKLQAYSGLIPHPDVPSKCSSEEENEDAFTCALKSKGKKHISNPFELVFMVCTNHCIVSGSTVLNGDLTENGDDSSKEEGENENEDIASLQTASAMSTKLGKKKKKKKRKQKEITAAAILPEKVEDEIEASIQEVNRILGEAGIAPSASFRADANVDFSTHMKALLAVEYKHLNLHNELRRIFGSRVIQTEQSRGRMRNRAAQRGGRLVQPKDTWHIIGRTGLTMSIVDRSNHSSGKNPMFTFEHNAQYQQVQFRFLDAVQSYNPQNIADIVHEYPYHIDSLIQLSEIFRMNEDAQTAVDLLERAIYVFECSFHPLFNVATGNCLLDFRRQENRAFFLVLFKHLTSIGQRGCYRTALEFCKVLLSLDPDDDPMCVLLMIDFYALRAEQYAFLIRMFDEWEPYRNLSQLPNFAFSVPLAMFHLSKENENYTERANKMLQESLLMFPGLLLPLLDKCGISPDKEVTSHNFFGTSEQLGQNQALKQLVALYVSRCYSCWKEADVVLWLETNVKATLQLVDAGDSRVKVFREKRKTRYQGTPRNIYRHFIISDIKDATATLPPELTNTPVLSYDPLPPHDAIISYTIPERSRAQPFENPLALFLRSLLPNFNTHAADDGNLGRVDAMGADGVENGGQENELQRGVGALMDAMRDLLNNIRLAPAPVENQNNTDEENEEDSDEEENELGEWD